MASTINTFNLNRLLKSITKSILICISTVIFCVVLDMFPLLLQRIGLLGNENIVQDIITVLQVLSILVIAIIKYAKEIYTKLLVLFDVTETEIEKLNDYDTNDIVPYSYNGEQL